MKSPDKPDCVSTRNRTDASLQGERQLLDELARECPPDFTGRIHLLVQARQQTDARFAEERAADAKSSFGRFVRSAHGTHGPRVGRRRPGRSGDPPRHVRARPEKPLERARGECRAVFEGSGQFPEHGDVQRTVRRMDSPHFQPSRSRAVEGRNISRGIRLAQCGRGHPRGGGDFPAPRRRPIALSEGRVPDPRHSDPNRLRWDLPGPFQSFFERHQRDAAGGIDLRSGGEGGGRGSDHGARFGSRDRGIRPGANLQSLLSARPCRTQGAGARTLHLEVDRSGARRPDLGGEQARTGSTFYFTVPGGGALLRPLPRPPCSSPWRNSAPAAQRDFCSFLSPPGRQCAGPGIFFGSGLLLTCSPGPSREGRC